MPYPRIAGEAAVRVEALNVSYTSREGAAGSPPILDSVSFTVEEGGLFGIAGASGAGKTTLAQLLAGLAEPCSGEIRYTCAGEPRSRTGMVFQNPEEQFFEETLAKDARAGLLNRGWSEAVMEEKIRRAFEWVGLDYSRFSDRSPYLLSGGEKRLAAVACVLSADPDLVVFDEPAAGLDPFHRRCIYRLIRTLNRQGKTVCIASCDLEWVTSLAGRILLVKEGKVLWTGETSRLFLYPHLVREAGLELPEIPFIMKLLADSGFPVRGAARTVREAAGMITGFFRNKV